MLNKKILIIYQPWGWGSYENTLIYPMLKELEDLGARVTLLDIADPPSFSNKYFPDKIENILRRLLFRDKTFIGTLEIRHFSRYYSKKLKFIDKKFDYTLIIRPDLYSMDFLNKVRAKSKHLVGYMWDGILPNWANKLRKTRCVFDSIFCFDQTDLTKYPDLNLRFSTNFYYAHTPNAKPKSPDISFVGGIDNNRRDRVIYDFISRHTSSFELKVFMDKGYLSENEALQDLRVSYIHEHIPYLKTLDVVASSKCLIDLCRPQHQGLSFRFFEAMAARKKIITNNKNVINYDFYRESNIMVIDFAKTLPKDMFENFIAAPYETVPQTIIQQYSFENWFKYLFDIGEYYPIRYGR